MAKTPAAPAAQGTPVLRDFSAPALLLILIGVLLNYLGGRLAAGQGLPLLLDTTGTILAGVIAGPWVGAVTGLLYHLGVGLTIDPAVLPYWPVGLAVGLAAGWMVRAAWFERWYRVIWAGLLLTLAALLVRAAVEAFLLGSEGAWAGLLSLRALSALGGGLIVTLVVFLIYKLLPPRLLARFPGSARRKKSRLRS